MPTNLPVSDLSYYTVLVDLEETTYAITYRWNVREEAWYIDIDEQDGTAIVKGQKVMPYNSPTFRWADARMPSGEILVFSSTPNERPGRDSFSSGNVRLWYLTSAEVAELDATV